YRPVGHRHDAAVCRTFPHHQSWRAWGRHRDAGSFPVPAGVHVAELRLRLGHRLYDRRSRRGHFPAQSVFREGSEMRSKSRSLLMRGVALHAALTPLAVIWLFPLWMMFIFSTMSDYGIFSPDIV